MVTDELLVLLLERVKLKNYNENSSLCCMLYMMYRMELNYPQTLTWLQSLFQYFDEDLVSQFALLSFKAFKTKIKMMKCINVCYQFFLDNPLYLQNAGFSHIPCPVCTSRYCNHFESDYLEYRDNSSIAADLHMYSSLIDEFEDEDHFHMTIYDTNIHVSRRECLPLSSTRVKVRNIFNVFFKDVQAYQYYMCLTKKEKAEYGRVHMVHNDIMARAYAILCSKFSRKLWPTAFLKLLKTLDVTQIKLVLIGNFPKKNSFLGPIFRGLSHQNVRVVFPRATKDEISRYPNCANPVCFRDDCKKCAIV